MSDLITTNITNYYSIIHYLGWFCGNIEASGSCQIQRKNAQMVLSRGRAGKCLASDAIVLLTPWDNTTVPIMIKRIWQQRENHLSTLVFLPHSALSPWPSKLLVQLFTKAWVSSTTLASALYRQLETTEKLYISLPALICCHPMLQRNRFSQNFWRRAQSMISPSAASTSEWRYKYINTTFHLPSDITNACYCIIRKFFIETCH